MANSWRVTHVAAVLALLIYGGGPAQAQDLKVGEIYRGSVQLTKDSGGIILPLPSGEWKLVALEPSRHASEVANLAAWSGSLVSLELSKQQQLKSFITFYMVASDMFAGGWKVPASCSADDMLHRERIEARRRKEIRCWGIKSYGMGVPTAAAQWYSDTIDWFAKNTKNTPASVIGVSYVRASGPKFLSVLYFFNPESEGQGRTGWSRNLVDADPKKTKYIGELKAFGTQWEPRIERGFAGKQP